MTEYIGPWRNINQRCIVKRLYSQVTAFIVKKLEQLLSTQQHMRGKTVVVTQYIVFSFYRWPAVRTRLHASHLTSNYAVYSHHILNWEPELGTHERALMEEKSAAVVTSSNGKIRVIRASILGLVIIIFIGYIFMWIMLPTSTYSSHFYPKIEAHAKSTFFGVAGLVLFDEFYVHISTSIMCA